MHLEIERKFLVIIENWDTSIEGVPYRQGYLAINDKNVVIIPASKAKLKLLIVKIIRSAFNPLLI